MKLRPRQLLKDLSKVQHSSIEIATGTLSSDAPEEAFQPTAQLVCLPSSATNQTKTGGSNLTLARYPRVRGRRGGRGPKIQTPNAWFDPAETRTLRRKARLERLRQASAQYPVLKLGFIAKSRSHQTSRGTTYYASVKPFFPFHDLWERDLCLEKEANDQPRVAS